MSEHWIERFSDYLDGALAAPERAALEAHLARCAGCAATLGELRDVVARARGLEPRAPEADLWPGIAARLRPRFATVRSPGAAGWLRRRFVFTFPQLAAAGLVLALLSAGAVWLAIERGRALPGAGTTPALAPVPPAATAAYDAAGYDVAVAELERVLHEHRSELDPGTVRILEENLAIIDRATEQARRALLADPANPYLNGHLAEQMKRKIKLLQRASDFVTAHS